MIKNHRIKKLKDKIIKDFKKDRRFKNARYQKEKEMYLQLSKSNISTPFLVFYEDTNKILELENVPHRVKSPIDKVKVIKELVKFQNQTHISPKNTFILNIVDNLSFRFFVTATTQIHKIGLKLYLKCMYELLDYHLNYSPFYKEILLHNDFHQENALKRNNSTITLIDFESCIKTRRWLFRDIAYYTYNPKTKTFDEPLFDYYLSISFLNNLSIDRKRKEKELQNLYLMIMKENLQYLKLKTKNI